jgi:hypothetical protein
MGRVGPFILPVLGEKGSDRENAGLGPDTLAGSPPPPATLFACRILGHMDLGYPLCTYLLDGAVVVQRAVKVAH